VPSSAFATAIVIISPSTVPLAPTTFPFASCIESDWSPAHFNTVEVPECIISIPIILEIHETEAFGSACVPIRHDSASHYSSG
jgi:hypothetical protein